MSAVEVVNIVLAVIVPMLLVGYLISVAVMLKHVEDALEQVVEDVRAFEVATRPVNPILGTIADDLAATQNALEYLLAVNDKTPAIASDPVMALPARPRGA